MAFLQKLKAKFTKEEQKDKYLSGLSKSRKRFGQRLRSLSNSFSGITDELLEEIMIILLESDVGIDTAQEILDLFVERKKELKNFDSMEDYLLSILKEYYLQGEQEELFAWNENGPSVLVLVGVNGSGKTTSAAKLLNYFRDEKKVGAVAADTFRAGAVEQLQTWCERLSVDCISGKPKQDPASVVVDGCRFAKEQDLDLLICDTAGRLQNKKNLMNELAKISRVAGREIDSAPQETWLVLDATTGQNGILQAKEFMDTSRITGIVLTKMDGTAKGGIVLAIKRQLGVPVKFIGLGEHPEDLQPFDIESYLVGITQGLE